MDLHNLASVFHGLLFDGGYLARPDLLVHSPAESAERAAGPAAARKPQFEPVAQACCAPRLGASAL